MIEIKMEKKPPALRIYVARHCESCAEALRLAEEIRQKYTIVNVEVIDLDAEDGQNLDDVFSVPTYVLNGKVISLGNPSPDELERQLLTPPQHQEKESRSRSRCERRPERMKIGSASSATIRQVALHFRRKN